MSWKDRTIVADVTEADWVSRFADEVIAGQDLCGLPGCRTPPELAAPRHQNAGGRNGG